MEIIRVKTQCKYCSEKSSIDSMVGSTSENVQMRIPREICISKCGAELSGCVYMGSCASQLCFSGIDSKLPAKIEEDSNIGVGWNVNVDNNEKAISIDPPAFVNLGHQFVEEGNRSQNVNEKEKKEGKDEESSKWIWLEPLLGFIGALVTAVAGIFAVYIMREKANALFFRSGPDIHSVTSIPFTPSRNESGNISFAPSIRSASSDISIDLSRSMDSRGVFTEKYDFK